MLYFVRFQLNSRDVPLSRSVGFALILNEGEIVHQIVFHDLYVFMESN